MEKKIKIAIIGCGVIGNAMKVWIENNNPDIKLLVSDPAKGYCDDVYQKSVDAFFISINVVNTQTDWSQDLGEIKKIMKKIRSVNEKAYIWIRSTITLSTFKKLNKQFKVNYLPEFLTERTAVEDFDRMDMVFTPTEDKKAIGFLHKVFKAKTGIDMSNVEAILTKYFHNIFGALKITYFNCINNLCDVQNVDFEAVRRGLMMTGHISPLYTMVPGPDGKFGFGGKCFPKDLEAFIGDMENKNMAKFDVSKYILFLIGKIPYINDRFRNEN